MGVQAFLYESLHGRYPDFPLATHFKQKHTQKSTFQLPTTDYDCTQGVANVSCHKL
jgi:hypothetical protein